MEAPAAATAPWLDLPDGLTELILERLPIADYIVFATVCPKWRSIQRHHSLRRRSPLPIPWICPYPYYLRDRRYCRCYRAKHMICLSPFDAPNNPNANPPPKCRSFSTTAALFKFPLASSTHGWLIMLARRFSETKPQELNFFDLVSGTHVPLPLLPRGADPFTACMSSPPTYPDCAVIIPCAHCVFLWRVGEPEWTTLPCPNTLTVFPPRVQTSIFHDGKFYFLRPESEGRLGLRLLLIDPDGDVVVWLVDMDWSHTPFVNKLWSYRMIQLVECNGDLLMVVSLVFRGMVDRPVPLQGLLLFRADFSRKMWVRVESLGDCALFISTACSFSLPAADVGVAENCVYLTDLFRLPLGAAATLWTMFDLGTGRVVHEPPHPDSYSKQQYRPTLLEGENFWIIPRLASVTPTSD